MVNGCDGGGGLLEKLFFWPEIRDISGGFVAVSTSATNSSICGGKT